MFFPRALVIGALLSAVAQAQQTYTVRVNPDGSFTPRVLNIRSGDTVRWEQLTRGDSVIPVTGSDAYPAMCSRRAPFDTSNPNNLTGPLPVAPSGIFAMSINGNGYREATGTCPGNARPTFAAGGKLLCPGGDYLATLDSTWKSPHSTGVFIRLLWKDVNPAEGRYDFSVLQREMENAVKAGKLFSLSIKAGQDGTPDWIFTTNPNDTARATGGGGVPRLHLQDDDDANDNSCGTKMDLGNPTNARYQQLYFAMLTETARFIKTRADWFRALAYIKTSGANLVSAENRLPNRCNPGCVCNTRVFAEDGYRPSRLYSYFNSLTNLLRDNFPGKSINYQLIQDGFPKINETGGWETADGTSSDRNPLPDGTEQTQEILDSAQSRLGTLFVVAHDGIQPKPAARCNFEGQHPKPVTTLAGYWAVSSGCPNRWAVREGAEGQVTGFQTINFQKGVDDSASAESALRNLYDNSDGVYLELYEEVFWLVTNTNNGVMPSGRSLAQWADEFHKRRVDPIFRNFTSTGDPFPTTWSRTFRNTNANGASLTLTYIHGAKCGAGNQEYGQIVIDAQPPVIRSGGIVSASGFGGGTAIAPGSWMEIYGSNFATTTREWAGPDFNGANAPTSLDGTSVRIGVQSAYVAFISPGQINAQVPAVAAGSQPLIVTTPAGSTAPFTIQVNDVQPGLSAPAVFNVGGRQYAAAQFPDGAFALPRDAIPGVNTRPARVGDSLTLYGIGFGGVTPAIAPGQVAAGSTTISRALQIMIGAARANVTYAGLAPGAVGLYQFNLVVPQIANVADTVPVTFTLGGTPGTQTLVIAVQ